MVWINGGDFLMGSEKGWPDERPVRRVAVDGFWIRKYEVTNREFAEFINATGYVTLAEKGLTKEDYPGVPDELRAAGSAVFSGLSNGGNAPAQQEQAWQFVEGASWRQPQGPGSSIDEKEDHPVVQIAYADAHAYATWRGEALPDEAQWEYAARGGLESEQYAWGGAERTPGGKQMANTWQGFFPLINNADDGYVFTAPVGCFPENGYGLNDMIGNVWEWTRLANVPENNPAMPQQVLKGGSFLCAENFCARYRPSARQVQDATLGADHIGFRTIRNAPAPPQESKEFQ